MGDLNLKGMLNLKGVLKLNPSGGKVLIGGKEALVVLPQAPPNKHGSAAAPVVQPPPPAAPIDSGLGVVVFLSFNQTVTAGAAGAALVTQGMVLQGGAARPWPGMVQPSTNNPNVKVNQMAVNVVGDMAVVFPSGGTATLDTSGQ